MTTSSPWPFETPEPGIYFDMPFSQYCAIPCLNAGGIKNLLASPTDFWARSWMNPLNDEIDEETKAKQDGRAYHLRILEGETKFYDHYAPDYEDDGDESMLRTNKDMERFLKNCGVKGYSGKKTEELIDMCFDADKTLRILAAEKALHQSQHEGKELIAAHTIRQIELAARMIEYHPHLKSFFAGGYPEVTIIWDEPDLGVRFKIRVDYLKTKAVNDLKTFANQYKKDVDKAIDYAMAANKYHIQALLYLIGVNQAKRTLVPQGKVFGAADPQWLEAFAKTPADEFGYVFMQKGVAPVAKGKLLSIKDEKFKALGVACINDGARRFLDHYRIYGTDAWIDMSQPSYIDFNQLPAFVGDL